MNRQILALFVVTVMLASSLAVLPPAHGAISQGQAQPAIKLSLNDPYSNITGNMLGISPYLAAWTGMTISTPYGFFTVGGNGFALYNRSTNSGISNMTSGYLTGVAYGNNLAIMVGTQFLPQAGINIYAFHFSNHTLQDLSSGILTANPGMSTSAILQSVAYKDGTFYIYGAYNLPNGSYSAPGARPLFYAINATTLSFTNLSSAVSPYIFTQSEMLPTPSGIFLLGLNQSESGATLLRYNGTFTDFTSDLPAGFLFGSLGTPYPRYASLFPSSNMLWYNGSLVIAGSTLVNSGGQTFSNLTLFMVNPGNRTSTMPPTGVSKYHGFVTSISEDQGVIFIAGSGDLNSYAQSITSPLVLCLRNLTQNGSASGIFDMSPVVPSFIDSVSTLVANGTEVFISGGPYVGNLQFGLITLLPEYSVSIVESGLPQGIPWYAAVDGKMFSSLGNTISFLLPNGTYSIGTGSLLTYYSGTQFSNVLILGQGQSLNCNFVQSVGSNTEVVGAVPQYTNVNSMDPTFSAYSAPDITMNLLQNLVVQGPNGSRFHPGLATGLPTIQNGQVNGNYSNYTVATPWGSSYVAHILPYENYTFYLRQNASWQNGSAVTPFDVAYTFARLLMQASFAGSGDLLLDTYGAFLYGSMLLPGTNDALSATFYNISQNITYNNSMHSVTFHFQQPMTPDFVYSLMSSYLSLIVDPAWIAKEMGNNRTLDSWSPQAFSNLPAQAANYSLSHSLFSDGPYQISEFLPGIGIIFKENPYYKSPGPWGPVAGVQSAAIDFSTQGIPQSSYSQYIDITNSALGATVTQPSSTYTLPYNTSELNYLDFNPDVNTSSVIANDMPINMPYNLFSSTDARNALKYSYDFAISIAPSQPLAGPSEGLVPRNIVPNGIYASPNGSALSQNISLAKYYWESFANTSQARASGLTFNGTDYLYNGNPLVIPMATYPGSINAAMVKGWQEALLQVIPGATIIMSTSVSSFTSYFNFPISSLGFFGDYPYPSEYYSILMNPQFVGINFSPAWLDNSSNSLSSSSEAAQYSSFISDVANITSTGNQTVANHFMEEAASLQANLSAAFPVFQSGGEWLISNELLLTPTEYSETNPYLTSLGIFLYNFAKFKPVPPTYFANFTFTGFASQYHNLSIAGGNPQYWFLYNGTKYFLNPTNYNELSFKLQNGTYVYSYGWTYGTNSVAYKHSVNISGPHPLTVVNFSRNQSGQPLYFVRVISTSLPVMEQFGTNITQVNGVAGEYVLIITPNGTVNFWVWGFNNPYRYYETVNVSGASVDVYVNLSRTPSGLKLYAVEFVNQNLPTDNPNARVNYNSTNISSSGYLSPYQTEYLYLPNGSYKYYVYWVNDFTDGFSGNFTVAGPGTVVSNNFASYFYFRVSFRPSIITGLPFSVNIGGTNYSSAYGYVNVSLMSGEYSPVVTLPSGYSTFSNISLEVSSAENYTFPVFTRTGGIVPLYQESGGAMPAATVPLASGYRLLVLYSSSLIGSSMVNMSSYGMLVDGKFASFNQSLPFYGQVPNSTMYISYITGAGTYSLLPGNHSISPYDLPNGTAQVSIYEVPATDDINYTHAQYFSDPTNATYILPQGYEFYLYSDLATGGVAANTDPVGSIRNVTTAVNSVQGISTQSILSFSDNLGIYPVSRLLTVSISNGSVRNYNLVFDVNASQPPSIWRLFVYINGYKTAFGGGNGSLLIVLRGILGSVQYALADSTGSIMKSGNLSVVSNLTVYLNVTAPPEYPNFLETGLPAGATWYVDAGTVSASSTSSMVTLGNISHGFYNFTIYTSEPGYYSNITEGSFNYNGTGFIIRISFSVPEGPFITTYGSRNQIAYVNNLSTSQLYIYGGLTSGTSQSGLLSYGTVLNGTALNGYNVASMSASASTANNFNGQSNSHYGMDWVSVINYTSFSDILKAYTPPIQPNSSFSVNFSVSTYSLVVFNGLAGGQYYISISGVPGLTVDTLSNSFGGLGMEVAHAYLSPGNYTVTEQTNNGDSGSNTRADLLGIFLFSHNSNLSVAPVVFRNENMPPGLNWTVSEGNQSVTAPALDTITLFLQHGTQTVNVSTPDKTWEPVTASLDLNVSVGALTEAVYYRNVLYTVSFEELGLPPGDFWYINITGLNNSSALNAATYQMSLENGTYSYYIATTDKEYYSPGGTFTVNGSNITVSIVFTLFKTTVQFVESGLPSGEAWYVNISGFNSSGPISGLSYYVNLTNGTYNYSIETPDKIYRANGSSFTVSGQPVLNSIQFYPVEYDVSFIESGLPSGTTWELSIWEPGVNSTVYYSAGSEISLQLTNWTYFYSLKTPGNIYAPVNATGEFNVSGKPLSFNVTFHEIRYSVTFNETGLPVPDWYVNISGMNSSGEISQSTYTIALPNGTYTFTIGTTEKKYRAYGNTFQVNGGNETVFIQFSLVTYLIKFSESGLPAGMSWQVEVNNTTGTSSSNIITFQLPNGTYSYTILGISGYRAGDYAGQFNVSGNPLSFNITWTQVTYNVTFQETGLQNGSIWYVNISGIASSGPISSAQYSVMLPNGTYIFSIGSQNKTFMAPGGTFVVLSAGETVNVQFNLVKYNVTFLESGLPAGITWYVNISGSGTSGPITGHTFTIYLVNGSYGYAIGTPDKIYGAFPGSFSVHGSSVALGVSFKPVLYNVTFNETGLPGNVIWYLNITNSESSTGSIVYALTNGTYTFTVASGNKIYAPDISGGSFTVAGKSLAFNITFTELVYNVTFTETGLPVADWYVNSTGFSPSGQLLGTTFSFTVPNGTYSYGIGTPDKMYRAMGGSFKVHGSSVVVNITFVLVTYNLTFLESGLLPGTDWEVILNSNSTVHSSNNSIIFTEPNGTYAYSITGIRDYRLISAATGSVSVNGQNITVQVKWQLITYNVTFAEQGLPSGVQWYVNVSGASPGEPINTSIMVMLLPNGTYSYSIGTPDKIYSAMDGTFTVNGSQLNLSISFSLVTYNITFKESGAPAGMDWTLLLSNGSSITTNSTQINLLLHNGTYDFNVLSGNSTYRAYGGVFTVQGAAFTVNIEFMEVVYSVNITESGIPEGYTWYVTLSNGLTFSSDFPYLVLALPNGTYTYTAHSYGQIYKPVSYPGSFTVNGSSLSQGIVFTKVVYNLTLLETGLPPGTQWGVAIDGQVIYSNGTSLSLMVSNGSYYYRITGVPGYHPTLSSGYLTVSGENATYAIVWSPNYYTVSFDETGLTTGSIWQVLLNHQIGEAVGQLNFLEVNGTYSFTIFQIQGYSISPVVGNISVKGNSVTVSILFTPILYTLNFTESGLPSGTVWNLSLSNGALGSTSLQYMSFEVPNGTFSYFPTSSDRYYGANGGEVSIDGHTITINISFTKQLFPVTFSVNGLPSNLSWSLYIFGKSYSISNANFTLLLPTGSFNYSIMTGGLYFAEPPIGTFFVSGSAVDINVTFVKTTSANVTTISVGKSPDALVSDSANGYLYVANYGSGNVTVINESTNKVLASIDVGSGPDAIVVDPQNGLVYVANYLSGTVSIINGTSLVSTDIVGSNPKALVYDSFNNFIYVANYGTDTVSVINASSDLVIANVTVQSGPSAFAINTTNGLVYVTNSLSDSVSIIDGTLYVRSFGVGADPSSLAYDPATGVLYIADSGSNEVTAAFFNPGGQSVSNTSTSTINGSQTSTGGSYGGSFGGSPSISGATGGTYEIVNNQVASQTPITPEVAFKAFYMDCGGQYYMTFDVIPKNNFMMVLNVSQLRDLIDYVASQAPAGLSPLINDTVIADLPVAAIDSTGIQVLSLLINIADGNWPGAALDLTGLILENGFNVHLPPSSAVGLTIDIANEIITEQSVLSEYLLANDPGITFTAGYAQYHPDAMVGLGQELQITFPLSGSPSGSFPSTVDVSLNYNYFVESIYALAASPVQNISLLSASNSSTVNLAQLSNKFSLTFEEQGLPQGISWGVILNGATIMSQSDDIVFSGQEGMNFTYSIVSPKGWYAYVPNGTIITCSDALTVVTFLPYRYSTIVKETGLLTGSTWGVNVNGSFYSATGNSMNIMLPNGTYNLSFITSGNYLMIPASQNITVNGKPQTIYVQFTPIINVRTDNIPVGVDPVDVIYDGVNNYIYVANYGSANVSVISGTHVIGTVSVGANPDYLVVDPRNGIVYVANYGSQTVSMISGTSLVGTIEVGAGPDAMVYSNGYVYVANSISGTISAIQTYSISFTSETSIINLNAAKSTSAIDPNSNMKYALPDPQNYIMVTKLPPIYSARFTETNLPVGAEWYVNFSNGESFSSTGIYLTAYLPNGTYNYTVHTVDKVYAPVSPSGTLTISGAPFSAKIGFYELTYTLTVLETGLPSGTPWYVNISGGASAHSVNDSVSMSLYDGTYTLAVHSGDSKYIPVTPTLLIHVNGTAVVETVVFKLVLYNVTLIQNGLPQGNAWYVNITNGGEYVSTSTSITIQLSNGTYNYTVSTTLKSYSASGGIISVNGAPLQRNITFNPVLFHVSIQESGLPGGAAWYFNISGGQHQLITGNLSQLALMNGSYSFSVAVDNKNYMPTYYSGQFIVDGKNIQISVVFVPVTYNISVSETGLPSGDVWYLNLTAGGSYASLSLSLILSLQNGTYHFDVASGDKRYEAYALTGTFVVSGKPISLNIAFKPVKYSINFLEKGFPAGGVWYVNITGLPSSGEITGSGFDIQLLNGTYSYSVSTPDKTYMAPGGTITVNGQNLTVSVVFALVVYPVTFREVGLPAGTEWYVIASGMGVLSSSSTTSTIVLMLANGSYEFNIPGVPGYHTLLNSGNFTVSGRSDTVNITWAINLYNISFEENSLPLGTSWMIYVNGNFHSSSNNYINLSLSNGTYSFTVSPVTGYTALNGSGTLGISGSNVTEVVEFVKNATLYLSVRPVGASVYIDGVEVSPGTFSLAPGTYYINASLAGYSSYSNFLYLGAGITHYIQIDLHPLPVYGYLAGNVTPKDALIVANGEVIPVQNGLFNCTLRPGTYYLSVTATGYQEEFYKVHVSKDKTTDIDITLTKISGTYVVSGHVNPANASVMFGEYSAYANSSGFYSISLAPGLYIVFIYYPGYEPIEKQLNIKNSINGLNFSLREGPRPSYEHIFENVTTSGFNVTVSSFKPIKGGYTISYTATSNGTLRLVIPYDGLGNTTIADILNSRLFINGQRYFNFSVSFLSINGNYSIVLTVHNLTGDPTLSWLYNPLAVPPKQPAKGLPFLELMAIIAGACSAVLVPGLYFIWRKRNN